MIELLSPAGDWDALVAAVENGADAVYLGMKSLNARRGAGNFDARELKRAVDYCHERSKRVYVTVNTVVKQDELPVLHDVARALADAGADAAIVQDFGVCEYLASALPLLPLHASTQMALHNAQGAVFLKNKGFARVVLAREMTYEEIRAVCATGLDAEVFCHGALCVACSGQCLFSSMVGGRSGNRGMCAQPCRMKYRLEGANGAEGYLLSTKDLNTIDILDEFSAAGVKSLKIEGRLKRSEYVAVVTRAYRRALDGYSVTDSDREALLQIYNRGGFTSGYAPGIIDSELISPKRPSHWGLKVGEAVSAREIRLEKDVLPGDALVIRADTGEDVPVKLKGDAGELTRNPSGARGSVMRLVSEAQLRWARESVRETRRTVKVRASVSIRVGERARMAVTDGRFTAEAAGWTVERARSAEADAGRITAQLTKTGGTPYELTDIDIERDDTAFTPASGLNALRRDALAALAAARVEGLRGCERALCAPAAPELAAMGAHTRLVAQANRAEQLLAAIDAGADEIALSPNDARDGRLDELARGLDQFFLCVPPVLPAESLARVNEWALNNAARLKGVYLTNVGQLGLCWPGERRMDWQLNILNEYALKFLGAEDMIYTPSLELSAKEIERVGGRRELIVYGRVPLMRLKHCPLNAQTGGGPHAKCGLCDGVSGAKRLEGCALIDRMRARFPLARIATDAGCVIDVLNSVPLSLARHARKLPKAEGWRMLFSGETAREARDATRLFINALSGQAPDTPGENTTSGHYFRPAE